MHENTLGYFPSGGWGWGWMGDPDRGFGLSQPGGWVFGTLSYLELQTLRDIGVGETFTQKKVSRVTLVAQPVGMFRCPTRPRDALCDYVPSVAGTKFNMNTTAAIMPVMRGDYAINAGSQSRNQIYPGPPSLADGDSPTYVWPDTSDHTGISYQRSKITAVQISDGLTKTLLLGEKYINALNYTNGLDFSENSNLYTGYENDNHRSTADRPQRDKDGLTLGEVFGSSHPNVFGMSMCDGSIRFTSFNVTPSVWTTMGGRQDGVYTSSEF